METTNDTIQTESQQDSFLRFSKKSCPSFDVCVFPSLHFNSENLYTGACVKLNIKPTITLRIVSKEYHDSLFPVL